MTLQYSNCFKKWIKLIRLQDWFYHLGIPAIAILQYRKYVNLEQAGKVLFFCSLYLCWGYVFNNYFDQKEDDFSKNKFKLINDSISLLITFGLLVALLVASFFEHLILETIIVVILNSLYSMPSIRLKRFLLTSLLSNGIFFSFAYYAAVNILLGHTDPFSMHFALYVFLIFLPIQHIHFLEHAEEAGAIAKSAQNLISAFLFFLLVLYTWELSSLHYLSSGTLVYSMVAFSCIVVVKSPKKSRRIIRWLSMLFGIYLIVRICIEMVSP